LPEYRTTTEALTNSGGSLSTMMSCASEPFGAAPIRVGGGIRRQLSRVDELSSSLTFAVRQVLLDAIDHEEPRMAPPDSTADSKMASSTRVTLAVWARMNPSRLYGIPLTLGRSFLVEERVRKLGKPKAVRSSPISRRASTRRRRDLGECPQVSLSALGVRVSQYPFRQLLSPTFEDLHGSFNCRSSSRSPAVSSDPRDWRVSRCARYGDNLEETSASKASC